MKKHSWFPTIIYEWQNLLEEEDFKQLSETSLIDNATIKYDRLENKIISSVQEIIKNTSIDDSYKVDITEIWSNISPRGKNHPYHTHPNSIFSGVYYITEGEPTIFVDPRPAKDAFQLKGHIEPLPFIAAIPNKLIIFPSWLPHYVNPNTTSDIRKTISFNILLRGDYGISGFRAETKI